MSVKEEVLFAVKGCWFICEGTDNGEVCGAKELIVNPTPLDRVKGPGNGWVRKTCGQVFCPDHAANPTQVNVPTRRPVDYEDPFA